MAGKTVEITLNLNPRTGLTLAGPTTPVVRRSAGDVHCGRLPPPSNIRDVTLDFGDGESQSLGAISASTTIQHTYDGGGHLHGESHRHGSQRLHRTGLDVDHDSAGPAAGGHRSRRRTTTRVSAKPSSSPRRSRARPRRSCATSGTSATAPCRATAVTTGNRATASYTLRPARRSSPSGSIQATGPSGEGQTAVIVRSGTLTVRSQLDMQSEKGSLESSDPFACTGNPRSAQSPNRLNRRARIHDSVLAIQRPHRETWV